MKPNPLFGDRNFRLPEYVTVSGNCPVCGRPISAYLKKGTCQNIPCVGGHVIQVCA